MNQNANINNRHFSDNSHILQNTHEHIYVFEEEEEMNTNYYDLTIEVSITSNEEEAMNISHMDDVSIASNSVTSVNSNETTPPE